MPAIVGNLYVAPDPGGDPDKVWLRCAFGEGGVFNRHRFESAMAQGMTDGNVVEALDNFFWEEF
jgi:hypothetical protein